MQWRLPVESTGFTLKVIIIAALICCIPAHESTANSSQPNIIFILADDLGWNDVSFHGYNEIPTPNIDRLAAEGVILNSYYAQALCTPSRTALLTGKYPIRLGFQHGVLHAGQRRGIDLEEKLLPQHLKELGYSTHMVGKWHAGYFSRKHTPTFRGFDSFFGYYNGVIDYYQHYSLMSTPSMTYNGTDLWDSEAPAKGYSGQYATEVFTKKCVKIVENHNFNEKPLFVYLSQISPHWSVLDGDRVQAPEEYIKHFEHIPHLNRRKYAATIAVLDQSVAEVFAALEKKDAINNTVVILLADNGATGHEGEWAAVPRPITFGSNWPLRGSKGTQWEAGVRVSGLVWGKQLKTPGRVSRYLYHVTDWLPTLYKLGGGRAPLANLDGFDIWPSISEGLPSPREEILIQADAYDNDYALRWQKYKIVLGGGIQGLDQWYEPVTGINATLLTFSPGSISCSGPQSTDVPCYPNVTACLFDVEKDPCERNNIAHVFPNITALLLSKLLQYNATAIPHREVPVEEAANPQLHDGMMAPWVADHGFVPRSLFISWLVPLSPFLSLAINPSR